VCSFLGRRRRIVVWNQPVDVKGGDKALTLDARNAMPVD